MATTRDEEVTELARRLARQGSSAESRVYSMSFWNERLLEWALARPEFKEQLFRFVDVFPATNGSADVLRHVREYLGGQDVPAPLRKAIGVASRVPFGARVTSSQARQNIERMANQFILGTTVKEAVKGAKNLWDSGSAAVVDLLGEKTVSEAEADDYARRVEEMLTALCEAAKTWKPNPKLDNDDSGPIARIGVSIKPTALASKYKPLTREEGLKQAADRLRPILRRAHEGGAFVWFDMELYEVKDLTIELFRSLLDEPEFADLKAGIVLQAYLRETRKDLASLIEWSGSRQVPASVRLVKGAYWDTETIIAKANDWPVPVFQQKVESDESYEQCTRLLLDNHARIKSTFASHNLRSLAHAITYARSLGLPDNAIEVQMLYGMAEPMHEAVKQEGLRLRVYAPVGEVVPGMAYLVRRLLENTSNESFVKLRYADNKKLDSIIGPPSVDRLPDEPGLATRDATAAGLPSQYQPEPLTQWHIDAQRNAMAGAIKTAKHDESEYVAAVIDGKPRRTEANIPSFNPARPAEVVAYSASCTTADVEDAMASARRAWPEWAKTSPRERAGLLFRVADWYRTRRFELAALEVREAGKPWADADGDVCEAIDFCEYYGREMLRLAEGGAVQSPPGETNVLHYEARGVGAVIAPWNFPLAIPTGMVVAALVTGNAVLFKPAEQTPAIASRLVQALQECGLPSGVLQFLPGVGEDVGAALVAHPKTSFVAFTGSRPVGLKILEEAAKVRPGQRDIKKVVLELGGKNALIIDSDADLDQVVPAVVQSAFGYSGQKCSALSRLIVLDAVKDQLHERVLGALANVKVGDPSAMAVDCGPVIDDEAHGRISAAVEGAFMWGDVLTPQRDLPAEGYFVSPTVVGDVKADSPLAKDEIFGPVLSTFGAADIDQALVLANDTEFALTAGVFSRSPSVIKRVTGDLRAANVYVNRSITGSIVGRQPFGGNGLSGNGTKAGGPDYLLNFMNPRTITENTVRQGFADLSWVP